MNTITLSQKPKFKHLSFEQYEYIIDEINKFNAFHKGQKRNIGKTAFIQDLASKVGTSRSNIYAILHDAKVSLVSSDLKPYTILSATAAFNKRSTKHESNHSKINKARPFIDLVTQEVKNNKMSSIDETINHFKLHEAEKIKGLCTVSTKTFYNYIHASLVDLKPIDLPRMVRRRQKKSYKTYIPKRQKGLSIEHRPSSIDTREEFGHWEGDLVTGPRDGKNGAYLTLLERKTRFYYMIPIKSKSAKQVYMKINKLHKFYGQAFSDIFKSITFDNGNEFSRWKDIEIKPGSKDKRTNVYFGRPYHSCDRASNENCNGLVRYFIPKGVNINKISKKQTMDINDKINQKKRKILGYLPAEKLFLEELASLNVTENTILYKAVS